MTLTFREQAPTAAAEPSRTERFCARLGAYLEGLAPADRLPFLLAQRTEWIGKFDRFTARVEAGEQPHWGESAFDYAETIAEIGRRITMEGVS